MNIIRVGVLGASGYAGRALCALIVRHPNLALAFATANEQAGEVARVAGRDITFVAGDDVVLDQADLVFSALPHGVSGEWVARVRAAGVRAVDLSADLRPGNGRAGFGGSAAHDDIVYGLTELNRAAIAGASVVANPGCYPTSILLALAPLVERGLVAPGASIIANAASGVTGAGNAPKRELLFAEVAEDFRAYGVGNGHRHLAEMRASLATWGADVDLVFTPHLLPVARGILSTIAVPLIQPLDDALAPYRDHYAHEPFVEIAESAPALRDVVHRNTVRISATMVRGTRIPTVIVTSAIDNLLKGAAGQAVQNANVMLGLDETAGLLA